MKKIKKRFKKVCATLVATTMLTSMISTLSVSAANEEPIVHTLTSVFAEDNGLPNSGIIIHVTNQYKGKKEIKPIRIGVQANPVSDKELNTQPSYYQDSALRLRADVYKYDEVTKKYVYDETQPLWGFTNESYTSTNDYQHILQVTYTPKTVGEDRVIVIRPLNFYYFNDSYNYPESAETEIKEQYLSNVFNFSYSVFLMDSVDYHSTDARVKNLETGDRTYMRFGGILDDIHNPRDEWELQLEQNSTYENNFATYTGINTEEQKTDFGLNIHFSEVPEGFNVDNDFYITASSQNAGPNLGYAKDASSEITGGYVLGLQTHGFRSETYYWSDKPEIIYQKSDITNVGENPSMLKFQTTHDNYTRTWDDTVENLAVVPTFIDGYKNGTDDQLTYASFSYSFGVKNPDEYTIKINNSDAILNFDEHGEYSATKPITNSQAVQGWNLTDDIDISIIPNDKADVDIDSKVYGDNGLSNYGVTIYSDTPTDDHAAPNKFTIDITPKATETHKTGNVAFAVDFYLLDDETMPFYRTDGATRKYKAPNDEQNGLPLNVFTGNWDDYYGKEYYMVARNLYGYGRAEIIKENVHYYSCPIGETTSITINNLGDKVILSSSKSQEYPFQIPETNLWYKHDGKRPMIVTVHPISPARSLYGPTEYDFDYAIHYDGGESTRDENEELDTTKIGFLDYFELDGVKYDRIGSSTTPTFNINSSNNKLDVITLYSRDNTACKNPSLKTLAPLQDQDGNFVGSFPLHIIQSGLIVKASDIIDAKKDVLPYVNIDVSVVDLPNTWEYSMLDSDCCSNFFAFIGTVDENQIFHIKNAYEKTDWINTAGTEYTYNRITKEYNSYNRYKDQYLSPSYTYTLHGHMDKNDVIVIVPVDGNTELQYDISMRNHNTYNIDMVSSDPAINIQKVVNNNIHYIGTTRSALEMAASENKTNGTQTLNIKFKGITSNNTATLVSKNQTVKTIPVTLVDYNVGKADGNFTIEKQNSELKFIFDPITNADLAVNMWRETPFPNIVKSTLGQDGTPVFNFTTPFTNLFTADKETVGECTKEGINTNMEFVYDPDTKTYSYNSVLHAASYNKTRNRIEMYDAGLGIDDWGMKGAGFYPFNSFADSTAWGTAEKYNLNTALVPNELINYHFGMALNAEFEVPQNGFEQINSQDVIFEFSGDDDVWVFIDDHLVLDLGGIHEAISGNINFTKGTISIGDKTRSISAANENDVGLMNWNSDAWNPNTTHKLSMFYLERGGTLSNCSMRFNVKIKNTYSVTYDANGGKGQVIDDEDYVENATVTVKATDGISKENATFVNWNTAADGTGTSFNANDTFQITENTKLYAIWKDNSKPDPQKKTFTVTYDTNGGEGLVVDDTKYNENATVIVKTADGISKTDNIFKQWNTKADGTGTAYSANDTFMITNNVTLYAIWSPVTKPDPDPEPNPDPTPNPTPDPDKPDPQPTPNQDYPVTADTTNPYIWIVLISLALISGVLVVSKKRAR